MTDIEKLFLRISHLAYPHTMQQVDGSISETAFFPGGTGVFGGENNLSTKHIMVLGQDFDCEANYKKSLDNGRENITQNATWRNLLVLFKQVGIDPIDCFFTNAIMGIRKGDKGTGKSPAFKDKVFIKECQELFLYQMEIQKPKIILVLGKHVAEFLAPTAKQLADWQSIKNFAGVDEAGSQVKENVVFDNGLIASLVLLTHPSFRPFECASTLISGGDSRCGRNKNDSSYSVIPQPAF